LKKYFFFSLLCVLGAQSVVAQYVAKEKTPFCNTSIEGLNRPKGLIIKQEFISGHGIYSTSGNTETFGKIQLARRREIKLKAPILNNPYNTPLI